MKHEVVTLLEDVIEDLNDSLIEECCEMRRDIVDLQHLTHEGEDVRVTVHRGEIFLLAFLRETETDLSRESHEVLLEEEELARRVQREIHHYLREEVGDGAQIAVGFS